MPYRIAGIDVHKTMLAVVVADVEIDGDLDFDREKVGTTPADLRALAAWLVAQEVEEVVMESTAQYWRPVWETLEQHWRPQRRARDGAPRLAGTLHLAQAQSIAAPVAASGTSRMRAVGETPGRSGADPELRALRRAAAVANRDATQVSAARGTACSCTTDWRRCSRMRT